MFKTVLGIGFGIATIAGGIYLYKKYGSSNRKAAMANVAGVILGDKIGGITGFVVAGPAGAIVGSVVGAVGAAIAVEDYLAVEGKSPQGFLL